MATKGVTDMDSAAPLFEVETQSATTISNVGGDQNVYLDEVRRRAAAIGRGAATVGLALCFGGLALLIATIVRTTQAVLGDLNGDGITSPYTQYVSGLWLPTVVLLVVGIVLVRFGRLYASR
jgi:hypothetical protein